MCMLVCVCARDASAHAGDAPLFERGRSILRDLIARFLLSEAATVARLVVVLIGEFGGGRGMAVEL